MKNQKTEKELLESTGFTGNNNYKIIDFTEGQSAKLKAFITETSLNPYNSSHGGFIFGLGDTAMGIVAASTGRKAVTLSSTINYLKPSQGEYIIAEATMIKSGKRTCYLKANIYNDKQELTTVMDSTFCYIE